MRFLIDCSAFAAADLPQETAFWRRILPWLREELSSHELFFLVRNSMVPFDGIPPEQMLNAPLPELGLHRVEERRLFRLCGDLKISAFLSTTYTSAGEKIPSVFVLSRAYPYLEQRDLPMLLARDSAMRSATMCVGLEPLAREYLSSAFGLPSERMRIIAATGDSEIAAEIAEALVAAAGTTVPLPRPPVAPWVLTVPELTAQFNTPAARDVQSQLQRHPASAAHLGPLNAVLWHCLTHRPQVYVEFGMRDVMVASLAAQLSPGIELYGSISAPLAPAQNAPAPTFDTAGQLMALPNKSVGRFYVCSAAELVKELAAASASPLEVDIAVLRPDPGTDEVLGEIDAVRPYLSERAAVVIAAPAPGEVSAMAEAVRQRHPGFVMFPLQNGAAALLLPATCTN